MFTAVIAAIKVKGLMMRNGKVGRDFKNHVVILGWNEKGAGTLEEILKWGSKVAILCKEDEQNIRETIPPQDTGEVVVLKGRPDREENLKKLRLEHANSVLILSTKHGDHLVDDMTAHIILSLRGYLDDLGLERGRPHIVAEIRSPEVVRKMRRAGADEIVCTANLGKNLLVNCTVSHGVSRVFEDLLTKSASTNEVYLHTVPEQFLGQSYGAFCRWVGQHEVDNDPIIPLGIRKSGDRMRTNPRDRESLILEAGDELILMAYNQKSLTTIEKAVVTASELT